MQKNNSFRIILDTNIWISLIISNNLSKIDEHLYNEKITLLLSKELIDEIINTIKKPKLKKYFKEGAIEEMLLAFENYSELVNVSSKIKICRDPNDDFLLELAESGKADFLVTGDKDLIEIGRIGNTTIIKLSEFLDKLI